MRIITSRGHGANQGSAANRRLAGQSDGSILRQQLLQLTGRFRRWSLSLSVGCQQMSRKRKAVFSVLGFGLIATLWLNVGVYRTREWRELNWFIKYRPSPKMFFHAPLGEATLSSLPGHEGYLTADQQREEQTYVEFVEQNWLQK